MASSSNSSTDPAFLALPSYLQQRIDRVFDLAVKPSRPHQQPSSSKTFHASTNSPPLAGGFTLPEDDVPMSSVGGGGFLVDSSPSSPAVGGGDVEMEDSPSQTETSRDTHITLAQIPSALQLLDLPPDDDQILGVFRNAASGWSSSSLATGDTASDGDLVSRDDWRAVCAVLLEHHTEEYSDNDDDGGGELGDTASNRDGDAQMDSNDDSDIDEYQSEPSEDEPSDDEYTEGPSTSAPRRRTRACGGKTRSMTSRSPSPPSNSSKPKKLTARQRDAVLAAYALFFPTAAPSELENQRIMIKDIQRVAKVLGEKLKVEEVRLPFNHTDDVE